MQNPYIPSYESDPELDSLFHAITGRRAFTYTPSADPLYRAAADRAVQNGRLAMRDTMGQAAALTGGYGSSYAQRVGQQQYGEYLRSLSEAMPQFYSLAYQRYNDEGKALRDAYDLSWQRREAADRRSRDDEKLRYDRQRDSYKLLYQLIAATGFDPEDGDLAAAGMSRAQANALREAYERQNQPRVTYVRAAQPEKEQTEDAEAEAMLRAIRPLMRKAGGVIGGKGSIRRK